jgi:uncharacterized protein (UPF0128 family)
MLRRSPRDNLQFRDLRQAGQNLILNTIREVGVLLLATEIIERQNGDTFFRNG